MRRSVLLAGLALASCAPEPPPPAPPTDPRLIVSPVLLQGLAFSGPGVTTLPDGRLRVVVNIRNPGPADIPLRVQTDWLDATGRPISTVAARPQFRSAARFTVTTVDADAPTSRTRDFRMTIDLEAP
ncbi:putative periplasmic lipoprotein [Roseomonas populi]|uniref:DUF1425 domain-containing protein n=1 Tax=Roseomonas populi TaxID=3121582 RepID=A0ABT1WYN7_9PROT|nr:hypothetical protein [Roseomonas pecuniae]MCR0980963.1 hypothetical protein [Roseomonas pecuniae]